MGCVIFRRYCGENEGERERGGGADESGGDRVGQVMTHISAGKAASLFGTATMYVPCRGARTYACLLLAA